MEKRKKSNLKLIILLLLLLGLNLQGTMTAISEPIFSKMDVSNTIYTSIIRENIKTTLVNEVNMFIDSMAPDNKLTPEIFVNVCNEYDLDITFVLAQALLESHFGTKGKAKETNSIFNVGTFDNGKVLYIYDTPDQSIEPYAKLIKTNYLRDKPLSTLIKDKGFKDINGYRFATAKKYEEGIRTLMLKINMNTQINLYQNIYKMNDNDLIAFFKHNVSIGMIANSYKLN